MTLEQFNKEVLSKTPEAIFVVRYGIYCNDCGKWLKLANRDERNLFLKLHLSAEYGKLVGGTK